MMSYKVKIGKLGLATIGAILPMKRHPMEDCVLGDHVGLGPNNSIGPETVLKGKCMIGPDVHIYTTAHYYDDTLHCFNGTTKPNPVVVGENVWIGYGVIILPGVSIGDNVIIGAGSVVTKDIPSGVMAAGNPCEVKRVIDKCIYDMQETN